MNNQYPYRKVLITGAGRGIGAQMCRHLVHKGVEVVALNRSREPVEKLIEELGGSGVISPYFIDVTKFEELENMLGQLLVEHPDIDLVILNAGLDVPQRIETFDWRIAQSQIDTNLTSNYVFVSALVPYLQARGGGHLALVSSLGSFVGCPYEHAYNASKAGARMLVDGLRAELAEGPINITGVYPGFIATDMIEGNAFTINSAMSVEDAATIILAGLERGDAEIFFPEDMAQLIAQVVNMPVEERMAVVSQLMNEGSKNL
jgi:short-subunit dehydrogenase